MSVTEQLDKSIARLREANERIEAARQLPLSLENLRDWLTAVTDVTSALSDIQSFSSESVHEKLHDLAGQVGVKISGKRVRPLPD